MFVLSLERRQAMQKNNSLLKDHKGVSINAFYSPRAVKSNTSGHQQQVNSCICMSHHCLIGPTSNYQEA